MTVHEHSGRPYQWVGTLSEKRAQLTPDQTALVDTDTARSFTYADLDSRANRTARLLRAAGVEPEDRVAVVSRNRPELVDCYFATGKLGAALAPLSHRLSPREIALMLDDIEPAVLLVEDQFSEAIAEALAHESVTTETPTLVGLESDGGEFASTDEIDEDWQTYDELWPTDDSAVQGPGVALSDPHLLLHTGGSTGLPKQVVQTHGSIAWNAFNTILSWGLRPDDVTPMLFPFFHTGGWNVLTIPLFHLGGTVIISRDVEPGAVLSTVESHDATVLVSVPAVLRSLVDHDEWRETDLSSLRFVKSGGGPCRDAVIDAWEQRGIEMSQGYGLTECGPNNFAMPASFPREKTKSIGQPGLYVDARVVDDEGTALPAGQVGELELASPHAANRYWHNDEETAQTFGDDEDDYPWVSTGDLARVDDEGYYYIEGRKKNMFISGGENVYPPEVEDVIADHSKVTEVIVVPVPDEQWGQVGKAVVEGDESLTLEDLRGFLDERLARFKHPRHLAFVDSMPTSGPGKIDRQAVEERFGEADN
jgi:fatty-acyl-CoA synthase